MLQALKIQKLYRPKIVKNLVNLIYFYLRVIMAKLTTKKRDALPKSAFAGPDRSYPVEDKSHARNAKARASEMKNKGKMSASMESKIDAKANKVLKRSEPKGAKR